MSRSVQTCFRIMDVVLGCWFHPVCVACGELSGESPLCRSCRSSWSFVTDPLCDKCGNSLSQPMPKCGECEAHLNTRLTRVRSLLWLGEKERSVLHKIKFSRRFELLPLFREMVEARAPDFFPTDTVVVPVPLHYARWRDRGFNQSDFLATWIARKHGLRLCLRGLQKVKVTPSQSSLTRSQRVRNLRVAFQWNRRQICPRNILLVDDVFTTGATLRMCAKALSRAGCESVYGWTLFRVPGLGRGGGQKKTGTQTSGARLFQ